MVRLKYPAQPRLGDGASVVSRILGILAVLAVLAASTAAPAAAAQPGVGSVFTYRVVAKTHVEGSLLGQGFNGTIVCVENVTLRVVEVTSSEIVFNQTVSQPSCNYTGSLGPLQGLQQSMMRGLQVNGTRTLRVGFRDKFDPENITVFLPPDNIEDDGVYNGTVSKSGTLVHYHVEYDKETGMLRYALLRSEMGQSAPGMSGWTSYEVTLTSQQLAGSGSSKSGTMLAVAAAVAAVAAVALAAAALKLRRPGEAAAAAPEA
jgi:hypothetical protein